MNKNWYISSTGKGLSLTLQGLSLGGLVGFFSFVFGLFGIDISENEITQLAETILMLISAVVTLFGLIRKIYFKIKK